MALCERITVSGTTPASASTAVLGTGVSIDVQRYASLRFHFTTVGATGGTLDLYVQTRANGGTTWYDYAALAQIAGGAAAGKAVFAVSRMQQQTTINTTIGVDLTPTLTANTVLGGDFGQEIRIVAKAGAGTSVGAAISCEIFGSSDF
jgi:hypothetical protein